MLYTAHRGEQVHSDRVGSVRAECPESEVCFPWLEPHIDSLIRYAGEALRARRKTGNMFQT